MKNREQYLSEIKDIRKLMEQSSRFLSLSGLSGILTGLYALVGAYIGYMILNNSPVNHTNYLQLHSTETIIKLAVLAIIILVLSLVTIIWLTLRRTKKTDSKFWNPGARMMLINLSIPLFTGGFLIIVLIDHGFYSLIAPSCLIFYGLALINAAKFTRQEIFYMGLFQIILGLLSAFISGSSLLFWAIGFGVLHIVYGSIMYFRYEKKLAS